MKKSSLILFILMTMEAFSFEPRMQAEVRTYTPEHLVPKKATIELLDGTKIIGTIEDKDGKYIIKSESAGEIIIEKDEAKIIEYKERVVKKKSEGKKTISDLQQMMLSDPDLINEIILRFATDKDFLDVISDPEVIKHIQDFNLLELLTNPKIQALTEKESIKDFTKKVTE